METAINLQRIEAETALITVVGTSPLIVHRWNVKAKQEMLAKQQGKKVAKQHKDPDADYQASRYIADPEGYDGFPTLAFKAATVKGGARAFGKAVKMTELRQVLTFIPDGMDSDDVPISRLTATDPVRREDMVRVGMGTADIRYRAMYREWSVQLRVRFLPSVIDLGSVAALIDAGGSNGVGEWRPEKNGSFGTYEVTT